MQATIPRTLGEEHEERNEKGNIEAEARGERMEGRGDRKRRKKEGRLNDIYSNGREGVGNGGNVSA